MFSWYKCLIVSLFFSHLGFWSGSLFLIAPFPDLCLLVLILVGWSRIFLSVAWLIGVQLAFFLLLRVSVSYLAPRNLHRLVGQLTESVESSFFIHQGRVVIMIYSFILDDSLSS